MQAIPKLTISGKLQQSDRYEDAEDLVGYLVLDIQLLGAPFADRSVGQAVALAGVDELLPETMHRHGRRILCVRASAR